MSAKTEIQRFGRALGIAAIFTVLGPIVLAVLVLLMVMVVGVPLLELMLMTVDLEALRPWISIASLLLVVITLVATAAPALVTGLGFAIASLYLGWNAWWVAVLIAVAICAGVVMLGLFAAPSEASAVITPPPVQGARQALVLTAFLAVPAAIAASLCWLVSRPLHRVPA